jgi:hypothetical protein
VRTTVVVKVSGAAHRYFGRYAAGALNTIHSVQRDLALPLSTTPSIDYCKRSSQ